jgi:hypothetical protein
VLRPLQNRLQLRWTASALPERLRSPANVVPDSERPGGRSVLGAGAGASLFEPIAVVAYWYSMLRDEVFA